MLFKAPQKSCCFDLESGPALAAVVKPVSSVSIFSAVALEEVGAEGTTSFSACEDGFGEMRNAG